MTVEEQPPPGALPVDGTGDSGYGWLKNFFGIVLALAFVSSGAFIGLKFMRTDGFNPTGTEVLWLWDYVTPALMAFVAAQLGITLTKPSAARFNDRLNTTFESEHGSIVFWADIFALLLIGGFFAYLAWNPHVMNDSKGTALKSAPDMVVQFYHYVVALVVAGGTSIGIARAQR